YRGEMEHFGGGPGKAGQGVPLFNGEGEAGAGQVRMWVKGGGGKSTDKRKQAGQSSDTAKQCVVRRGDTLSSIAAAEYSDPSQWRPIAHHNGLEDPLDLRPGMVLLLPALTVGRTGRSQT